MLEIDTFESEENQQPFPRQSQTQRPLRPYQQNRQYKKPTTILSEEDEQFQLSNNLRNPPNTEDLFDSEQANYYTKPSFLKRNLPQTTRNDALPSNYSHKFTNIYEDQDNTPSESLNSYLQHRASAQLISLPKMPNSVRQPPMTSINARAKLAEQQKLRQTQVRKAPEVEYFTLEQILAQQAEAKKAHAQIDSQPSEMFYDPTKKTETKEENLPELAKENIVIGSRFDEVYLENESHMESRQVVANIYEVKEKRVYQQQQRYVPVNSPLAASRQSPNEIFTSVNRQSIKFEEEQEKEEAPLDTEPENKLALSKGLEIEVEKKEEANEDDIQTALSPAPANEKAIIFKANLKDISAMKVFLMSPCPKGQRMQCSVRRDRTGLNRFYPKYHCLLSDGLQYMMTAKKRAGNRTSNYIIGYTQKDIKKESQYCLGKLRSNFLGTEFNIYDQGDNPAKTRDINRLRANLGVVVYEENVISGKAARKKKVYIPEINPDTNEAYEFKPLNGRDHIYYHWQNEKKNGIKELVNKKPYWSDEHNTYILDYGGRAKLPSIKNFQLIDGQDDKHIFLQFGKNTENTYILDFEWPLSPFQAFAICLSSFDYKIACE